jgi:hypothetical protein
MWNLPVIGPGLFVVGVAIVLALRWYFDRKKH